MRFPNAIKLLKKQQSKMVNGLANDSFSDEDISSVVDVISQMDDELRELVKQTNDTYEEGDLREGPKAVEK